MSNIPDLQNVPELSFIDNLTLAQVREQIIQDYATKYRELTGEDAALSDADPIRLVLLTFAQQFYQGLQYVDWAGKKNLLKYSYGEALDNLAANKGIKRNPASYATATLQFSLQNARTSATSIPAGTRVSTNTGVYFMTSSYVEIPAGQLTATVQGVALEAGMAANDIPAGTIVQIVDPVPYIYTVTNTTPSVGGADVEDDESLTERIFLYPSSYSTAGAEAAYIYWAKTYRSDVSDVMAYNAKLLHAITDASTILDRAREILVNGRLEATSSSEFLFRSVESNIFGVVRAQTVDEASQILSEELGESVELMRVDDDLVFWSSRSQA